MHSGRDLHARRTAIASRRVGVARASASPLGLRSLAHGVISLEQLSPVYGPERRRLRVAKMRGVAFRGGYHDFRIERGGLRIFERL